MVTVETDNPRIAIEARIAMTRRRLRNAETNERQARAWVAFFRPLAADPSCGNRKEATRQADTNEAAAAKFAATRAAIALELAAVRAELEAVTAATA